MDDFRPRPETDARSDVPERNGPSFSDEDLRWAGLADAADSAPFDNEPELADVVLSADTGDKAPSSTIESGTTESGTQDGVAVPFGGDGAEPRVAGARRALDDAMVAWLSTDAMPSTSVLRDGLLLINAGHEVDEGLRALLLRAALFHRRGILTALPHQADLERSALILHDAIVDPSHPLPLAELEHLLQDDPTVDGWEPYLHAELLATARSYDTARSRLADAALLLLDTGEIIEPAKVEEPYTLDENSQALEEIVEELEDGRLPLRQAFLITLFLMLVFALMLVALLQYERSRTAGMAAIPGGEYTLSNDDGSTRALFLGDFLLDELEVTNRQYRRCVQRGNCPQPAQANSLTRRNYFDDPAFDQFPVLYVDHDAAVAYCEWAGKRLPAADEWQAAASLAPATGRTYLYPWGDRYFEGVANDANAVHGDTLAVGAYRPGGDSPLGLSDMAGNVAEWTSTPGLTSSGITVSDKTEPFSYQVRGGSFADGAELLRADSVVELETSAATATVGIRCASRSLASVLLGQIQ